MNNSDPREYEESSLVANGAGNSYADSAYNQNVGMVEKAQAINQLVYTNAEVIHKTLDVTQQVVEVYAESQRLNAQVEVVKTMGQVELAKIAAKFQTAQNLIEKAFGERGQALNAHYRVLDDAINSGDRDMIIQAMNQISSIVVSSPLADITKFIEVFEDKSQPLLDF